MATSTPRLANTPSTLNTGTETVVAGSAVQVIAANTARISVIVQNVGAANVRVGTSGVTATTGVRLVPNGHLLLEIPSCPVGAIFAIREGAISSTVLTQELTK